MQDLGTLGGTLSVGFGINNSGWVVGNSRETSNRFRAFLYDGTNMLDLCELVDCVTAGWSLLEKAEAINDKGDITGWGTIDGERHAFLISSAPLVSIDIEPDGAEQECS